MAWSVWGRVAACCKYLWVWYVSCCAVLAMAVRCMCAAVAWGSSAWVRSKVYTALGTSPLRTAWSTSVCLRTVASCWVAGDHVGHAACCAMVWVGFQSVRVSSPRYRGHPLKWSQVSSSAWPQMHLVYLAGTRIERRAYHWWYQVRRGSCARASWRQGFCRCAGRLSRRRAE